MVCGPFQYGIAFLSSNLDIAHEPRSRPMLPSLFVHSVAQFLIMHMMYTQLVEILLKLAFVVILLPTDIKKHLQKPWFYVSHCTLPIFVWNLILP